MLLNNQTFICIFHFIDKLRTVLLYKGNRNIFSNWKETTVYTFLIPTSDNLLTVLISEHMYFTSRIIPPPSKFWSTQKKSTVSCLQNTFHAQILVFKIISFST